MDTQEKCAQLFGQYASICLEVFARNNGRLLDRIQSDIEAVFIVGFACEAANYELDLLYSWGSTNRHIDGCDASICAQGKVGPYTADFLISFYEPDGTLWLTIAIECDGHDFHEKTKQQAQRDKARDRYFQINHIHVLRFAGSEIWRNARRCARDVFKLYEAKGDVA